MCIRDSHITIKMDKEVGRIIRDIGKYQLNDYKLKTIINKISIGSVDKELSEFYKYVNGKLYRRRKNDWKLYVPDSVSVKLITEIHSMYGHLGAKKCMEMLQEHFHYGQDARESESSHKNV